MAAVSSSIVVKPELRPCTIDGKVCLFHKWVTEYVPRSIQTLSDDPEDDACEIMMCETTMALVEHEDGSISTESMQLVKFLDTDDHMGDM